MKKDTKLREPGRYWIKALPRAVLTSRCSSFSMSKVPPLLSCSFGKVIGEYSISRIGPSGPSKCWMRFLTWALANKMLERARASILVNKLLVCDFLDRQLSSRDDKKEMRLSPLVEERPVFMIPGDPVRCARWSSHDLELTRLRERRVRDDETSE